MITNELALQTTIHDFVRNNERPWDRAEQPPTDEQLQLEAIKVLLDLHGSALQAAHLSVVYATCAETARGWREEV